MLVTPLSISDRRGRQNRRSRCSLRLPLGFDLADQHGWGDCADGDAAGLGAADTVEDVLLVAGCDDAWRRTSYAECAARPAAFRWTTGLFGGGTHR